ncbi:MAG: NAD(P)H-hydrate epimerase, partial [Pseudomonadota bacterium]|nr:NAD(P)H-hydrate epimerase [Pseudomonadota bacterium]
MSFDKLPLCSQFLLDKARMSAADKAAIAGGVSGHVLMERAGTAVSEAIISRFSMRDVCVLAGPGNNGGDGYVAARILAGNGWPVRVAQAVESECLKGDAARAASLWTGPVLPLDSNALAGDPLIVDALF